MENKTFTSPATLSRISSTADGGLSLGFRTQELTPEEKLIALKFQNAFGWLMFKENSFDLKDVPKEPALVEAESPAKRLRAVLFVAWKQKKPDSDFNTYYARQMESFIEMVKLTLV